MTHISKTAVILSKGHHARLQAELIKVAALERENAILSAFVRDFHFAVRRYADGRATYLTGELNAQTRQLLALGIEIRTPDGTPWARDAFGRACDGLTDEEALLGKEPR